MESVVKMSFMDSIAVKQSVIENEKMLGIIDGFAEEIVKSLKNGGKLILCGNGGSASDALHFAGEIVGRFQEERNPWPAIVLNADVASMTAIANDYGYQYIYARQVKGFLRPEDVFLGISTSGNSQNIIEAVQVAKQIGASTGALLGKDGGRLKELVDYPIIVECNVIARVQESHITIIHSICEMVETELKGF